MEKEGGEAADQRTDAFKEPSEKRGTRKGLGCRKGVVIYEP